MNATAKPNLSGPGQDDAWKQRDWSWVEQGLCVRWADLHPESEAWVFEHEGAHFFVDDQYCATASCDCADAMLCFFRVERRGPEDSEGVPLGVVRYELRTGRRRAEPEPGTSARTLSRLSEALFEDRPEVRGELERRFRRMRGFADWLQERRLAERPAPAAPRPGRNDPCPCGSGRKYKKCCLR